jgi:general secretion pathway protein M
VSAVLKNDLVARLVEKYEALAPRERQMALAVAVVVLVALVVGLLMPLDQSVTHAQQRLAKKKADLVWMQGVAPQLAGLPAPPADTGESLLVIVDRSARESGLGSSLSGSDPGTSGALTVRLQKAPFNALVAWLARLAQQNGIVVQSATIDGAGAPGLVNAAVVLHSG